MGQFLPRYLAERAAALLPQSCRAANVTGQRRKRFWQKCGDRQGRHAPPAGLQEGDGKCALCLRYPLPERRFPLEADECRHRLFRIRPRLIAREQATAVVGCANPPHPFPRGRGRCCPTKSESYPKGAVEDYPQKLSRLEGYPEIFHVSFAARVSENSKTHHAVVVMPSLVNSCHGHLLW